MIISCVAGMSIPIYYLIPPAACRDAAAGISQSLKALRTPAAEKLSVRGSLSVFQNAPCCSEKIMLPFYSQEINKTFDFLLDNKSRLRKSQTLPRRTAGAFVWSHRKWNVNASLYPVLELFPVNRTAQVEAPLSRA